MSKPDATNDFVLTCLIHADGVQVYRMHRPNSRMGSTQLSFTPEGIAIQGDVCVDGHGVCSAYGYGLGWFAGELGASYLCEKFLRKEWVPAVADAALRELLHGTDDWGLELDDNDKLRAVLEELLFDTESGCFENSPYYHQDAYYQALGHIDEWGEIGWTYPPQQVTRLIEIQRRFRELWLRKEAAMITCECGWRCGPDSNYCGGCGSQLQRREG